MFIKWMKNRAQQKALNMLRADNEAIRNFVIESKRSYKGLIGFSGVLDTPALNQVLNQGISSLSKSLHNPLTKHQVITLRREFIEDFMCKCISDFEYYAGIVQVASLRRVLEIGRLLHQSITILKGWKLLERYPNQQLHLSRLFRIINSHYQLAVVQIMENVSLTTNASYREEITCRDIDTLLEAKFITKSKAFAYHRQLGRRDAISSSSIKIPVKLSTQSFKDWFGSVLDQVDSLTGAPQHQSVFV